MRGIAISARTWSRLARPMSARASAGAMTTPSPANASISASTGATQPKSTIVPAQSNTTALIAPVSMSLAPSGQPVADDGLGEAEADRGAAAGGDHDEPHVVRRGVD